MRNVIWVSDSNDDDVAFRMGSISCSAVPSGDDTTVPETDDTETQAPDSGQDPDTDAGQLHATGDDAANESTSDGQLAKTGMAVAVLVALGVIFVVLGVIVTAARRWA